ncbi:Jerky protein [Phytophthora megakarya]|uniref:Jerky protein n=1 Tax=Phytophthora megakarya TaxID=4795 RepID=A0A225WUQ3_9STRA|nr:Jerky protein [Phytophthora megakarya]
MEEDLSTITDYGLTYRLKLFVDEKFDSLPADKRPGFSKGWFYRFRKRQGIRCLRQHGEYASVNVESVVEGRASIHRITDQYRLCDIYNMDESAFFYHADAPRTLSRNPEVAGFKADKARLTMAAATNADGSDKLPLLFIGKSAKPRVFKGHNVTSEFGVEYTNTQKAWMNSEKFARWLHHLDLRMILEQRHILLLVGNVSSHAKPSVPLTNVNEFLPKNTTSVLQPLDQGIIACIKSHFTRIKVEDCIDRYIAGLPQEKISLLTALEWAHQAWSAVTPQTISNCWKHSGITTSMAIHRILH